MEFGKRLLPQVVDHYARIEPNRVYASIPKSDNDPSYGYQDVTMGVLASMVNHTAYWIESVVGTGALDTIAYLGLPDIRYTVIFLAAIKCRYKVLFISPRNQDRHNFSMLESSNCTALLYDEEVKPSTLIANLKPGVAAVTILSLDEMLTVSESVRHFPFQESFEEIQNQPCLILHSSGSTGDPKLVTMTHGTFAVTDNDRNVPVPEGRIPQNGTQFNFEGGGKFYSCFPPYHLAGVHAYITLPIFSTSATVVLGPKKLPPTGYLLSEILKVQEVRGFYVPPFIIEQWTAEPISEEQAKQLHFVLFGGGPLSPLVGDRLEKVTKVCQMYGSLEIGQVQILIPQPGEWSYMEFNPYEEVDMQSMGDGSFEMVLHQNPKLAASRSLAHNFPDAKSWHTGDLFIPHPVKPGLWRFHSRKDDLIIFSSSHKLRPLEMETILHGDPLVSGALIVGQRKPQPLLIVEPSPGVFDSSNPQAFMDQLWPTIEIANSIAPSYARISRSKVIIADSDRPFPRAPKGNIVRKLAVKLYAQDIDDAFVTPDCQLENAVSDNLSSELSIDNFLRSAVHDFVQQHVERILPGVSLADTDDFFACGMDSIGCVSLSRNLRNGLESQFRLGTGNRITMRLLYKNPTIRTLSGVVFLMIFGNVYNGSTKFRTNDAKHMERVVTRFTKGLPAKSDVQRVSTLPVTTNKLKVVLLGPRGTLGPHILSELLLNPDVDKIYCLNRGVDGFERMEALFSDLNLPCQLDRARVTFIPIELGKGKLGLSHAQYTTLTKEANIIIHNSWKVDFGWALESFTSEHLHSVREIFDLATHCEAKARVVFISSISSVQHWSEIHPGTPVPEDISASFEVVPRSGYGQSKNVAERILAQASRESSIPVTILRMGQVAGSNKPNGSRWNKSDWVPLLATISKIVQRVPNNLPTINWVPVEVAAKIVCELGLMCSTHKLNGDDTTPTVYHVMNPKTIDWEVFVRVFKGCNLSREFNEVPLIEWTNYLQGLSSSSMSKEDMNLIEKGLPFFEELSETVSLGFSMQPAYDLSGAVKASKALANVTAIDEVLLSLWLKQWGI